MLLCCCGMVIALLLIGGFSLTLLTEEEVEIEQNVDDVEPELDFCAEFNLTDTGMREALQF